MVNVHYPVRASAHSVLTPRIVPKAASRNTGESGGPCTPEPAASSEPERDFRALFSGQAATPASEAPAAKSAPTAIPTLESMFGPDPWMKNPTGIGPDGVTFNYNPMQFATRATAEKLAQMYGGTVIETNATAPYGPFQQNQPNELIQFSNGTVLNAGLVLSYFNRGYTQDQIDHFVRADIGPMGS